MCLRAAEVRQSSSSVLQDYKLEQVLPPAQDMIMKRPYVLYVICIYHTTTVHTTVL